VIEVNIMEIRNIKEKARSLIDKLPDNSTWDNLMYQIYVIQAIEAGLSDSEAGRVISVEEVLDKFKL
jgi:predicted transcriptional regulator